MKGTHPNQRLLNLLILSGSFPGLEPFAEAAVRCERTRAGDSNAIPGDYLFRDYGAYGNASGLWGILRVTNEAEPAPAPTP